MSYKPIPDTLVSATVTAGDLEFGAAEIKDATSDNRAGVVNADPGPTDYALEVRPVGQAALFGAVNETAPATDTASSGLNGRLQRIAQRITSLIALLPASLGGKTAAASLSITTATDDPLVALFGGVTETAPGTDTASSGLNGRLQRIAQRVTSLIALLPASLGVKAGASSLAVAISTEDAAKFTAPSTGTITSVNDTNADGTILAANASRKGAAFFNDSTVVLYLALSNVTSSATVHTVQIAAGGYYELPVCQGGVYTGVVKGIWASDASGAVRVTELT